MRLRQAQTLTVIGAGLTGSLLSLYLLRAGWRVRVFEKRGDPRTADAYSGRSINLALARRGLHALEEVGLSEAVRPHLMPMRGRMIHPVSGDRVLQPYGQNEREVIYSVHRATLNRILIEGAAQHVDFELHAHQKLIDLDPAMGRMTLEDAHSGAKQAVTAAGPIFGADGAGSKTRRLLEASLGFQSRVDFLEHGYKELGIPAREDGGFAFDAAALHIWPRGGFMQIALPNEDGSYTNTLFLDRSRFDALRDAGDAAAFLRREFPDLTPWNANQARELAERPVGLLGTVYCPTWHDEGNVLLIGDAAHAIVPFHGQGMNCCFEDCSLLAARLTDGRRTWKRVFAEFQARRKPNTNAIAQMALENYEEMRSDVVDPRYKLQRKLELMLERRHPGVFIPRYSMVMFHRVPYATALARGAVQADILDQLTAGLTDIAQVNMEAADRLIHRLLPLPVGEVVSVASG